MPCPTWYGLSAGMGRVRMVSVDKHTEASICKGVAELLEHQWPQFGVAVRLANLQESTSVHYAALSAELSIVIGHVQKRKANGGEAPDLSAQESYGSILWHPPSPPPRPSLKGMLQR